MRTTIVVALGLVACATPYQPHGYTGGYKDRQLAPGVYWVGVNGNGYTSQSTLVSYMQRRGLELCNSAGYPHVRFLDQNASVQTTTTPTEYHTVSTSPGDATTYQTGGYQANKYSVACKAVCMTQEEYNAMENGMRQHLLSQP